MVAKNGKAIRLIPAKSGKFYSGRIKTNNRK